MSVIEARGLTKSYGKVTALDGLDLSVPAGRIVGLIGPNGAGKSTALNAILGLIPAEGHLKVLGRDPWSERDRLMEEIAFVADVAVLPRWIRIADVIDYVEGVHPRFDRARAEAFLARTDVKRRGRVRELSKGMLAQLHLSLVMAIDARLLVLDEPTLGLDLLYRKAFYDTLLNDYFDGDRTIVVSTHQVDEIQNILTDVVFLNHGRIVLDSPMEALEQRFAEVMVRADALDPARKLGPIHQRQVFDRTLLIYDGADRAALSKLGEVRTPSLADLFIATMGPKAETGRQS